MNVKSTYLKFSVQCNKKCIEQVKNYLEILGGAVYVWEYKFFFPTFSNELFSTVVFYVLDKRREEYVYNLMRRLTKNVVCGYEKIKEFNNDK